MSSSAQRELETFANWHGLSVGYTGYPSLCEVLVSVNGVPYSATHPDQNTALEMASGSALSDLRQRLAQRNSNPYSTPRYVTTPQYHHGTPHPSHHATTESRDYRMHLNNMAAARGLTPVSYEGETRTGPEHNPTWTSTVYVCGVKRGEGWGRSKGAARERAAQQALDHLASLSYEYSGRLPSCQLHTSY